MTNTNNIMPVTVWGPPVLKIPAAGIRHVVLGLALGVLILPLLPVIIYVAMNSNNPATALTASTDFLSKTGPGILLGELLLWGGWLFGVFLGARQEGKLLNSKSTDGTKYGVLAGFKTLIGWSFKKKDILTALIFVIIAVPTSIGIGLGLQALGVPGKDLGNTSEVTSITGPWLIATLLIGTLGAPIVEEIFFRGLFLQVLRKVKKLPTWVAVVIVSLVFGSLHAQGNLISVVYLVGTTAALGSVFAIFRIKTGRIAPSMIAHILFNTINLILTFWTPAFLK